MVGREWGNGSFEFLIPFHHNTTPMSISLSMFPVLLPLLLHDSDSPFFLAGYPLHCTPLYQRTYKQFLRAILYEMKTIPKKPTVQSPIIISMFNSLIPDYTPVGKSSSVPVIASNEQLSVAGRGGFGFMLLEGDEGTKASF